MKNLVFESSQRLAQPEFSAFVAERQRRGERHHFELMQGRVVLNPAPGYPHGEVGSNVQLTLALFVKQRGLGKVFDATQGFELPSGDWVQPDHSFVSNQRWRAAPVPVTGEFLKVVPDLVVEVTNACTASQDRGLRKLIYEMNGVREYWLVDLLAHRMTAFLMRGQHFGGGRTIDIDARYASTVLAGLEFPMTELFPAE